MNQNQPEHSENPGKNATEGSPVHHWKFAKECTDLWHSSQCHGEQRQSNHRCSNGSDYIFCCRSGNSRWLDFWCFVGLQRWMSAVNLVTKHRNRGIFLFNTFHINEQKDSFHISFHQMMETASLLRLGQKAHFFQKTIHLVSPSVTLLSKMKS